MPTIRVQTAATELAAGAKAFPLQGSQYEYLPFNALVEFAVVERGAANGAKATVYSGTDVLQQDATIEAKSEPIQYPYDFLISDAAAAGERLSVELTGGDGGTPVPVETVVRITPL